MATSAFGKAFRAARDAGDTEFEFNGKKYNTKLKEEDSGSSKSSTRAARPTSTETRSAPEPRESAVAASNDQTSSAPSSDSSSSSKSWWTTPNKNLQEGTFPSGKEIRSALGSSYKKGGSVSSRADGIAQRGKTRGKMC
jgi:hypothetical protein